MSNARTRTNPLGWEAYAWLIYLLPFVFTAIGGPFTTLQKGVMAVSIVAFLPLYFGAYFVRTPHILWIVAALDALAIINNQWNSAAAVFFVYAAACIANGFTPAIAMRVLAGQVLLSTAASYAIGAEWWVYMMSIVISTLVGSLTIQARAKEAGDAKLRMAQDEVARLAKLAERERIARDLHDLLGHTLSVVVLKSELAQKLMSRDPARALQEIAEVERISRQGLAEVREAITGYRSSGLVTEIEHLRETLTAAGIETTVLANEVPLAPAQDRALSLALREAVTNVIRHAAATKCQIRLYAKDGSALMEVQDDGRGGDAPFGNGLSGMRDRIQALGGVLRRDTAQGTRVMISLPL
jgi:two-component system sensor histidine kinase DesK